MQRTDRTTLNPQNRPPAAPQGNRTANGQAKAASSPINRVSVTPSAGAGNHTESTSKNTVTCRKCKSTQIVANKRGYSFANMFKTLGSIIFIGILSIVFVTVYMWYGISSSSSSSVAGAFGAIGMILLFLSLPTSILVGFIGRNEIVNGCMNCGFKWRPAKRK